MDMMGMVQDWTRYLFLSPTSPLRPYAFRLLTLPSSLSALVNPLLNSLTTKPDLATIALLLVILFLSLKILNMLWQAMLFWVKLAYRIVFWGGLAALGLWMWTRGPDGVLEDIGHWAGVWTKEYQSLKEREGVARGMADPYSGGGRARVGGRW